MTTRASRELLKDLSDEAGRRERLAKRQRAHLQALLEASILDPPNYSAIRRLLSQPAQTEAETGMSEAAEIFDSLREETQAAWEESSPFLIGDLIKLAEGEGLQVQGQPPSLTIGRGIRVEIKLFDNRSIVNGVQIQSVDPRDVLGKVKEEQDRLWESDFDPVGFLETAHEAYKSMLGVGNEDTDGVPILELYEAVRATMTKAKARGFTKDWFSASVSRAIQAGARTSDGYIVDLRPTATRTDALWMYDAARDEWSYRGRLIFREA